MFVSFFGRSGAQARYASLKRSGAQARYAVP